MQVLRNRELSYGAVWNVSNWMYTYTNDDALTKKIVDDEEVKQFMSDCKLDM